MFSVDLESAYHHVEIHDSSWQNLGFEWQGKQYLFTVLPFGLSSACWVFTKLTRELVGHWRAQGVRLIHYLDDFLFAVARDSDGGYSNFYRVQKHILQDIKDAGFSLSELKLQLDPRQSIPFLGLNHPCSAEFADRRTGQGSRVQRHPSQATSWWTAHPCQIARKAHRSAAVHGTSARSCCQDLHPCYL